MITETTPQPGWGHVTIQRSVLAGALLQAATGSTYHSLVALLKSKLLCLMYSEAKQYQNARVWNRERFITGPMKEMVAHAPKCQIPQRVSAKHF